MIHSVEGQIALRFDRVSFSYGTLTVLEKASFHIHRGEFIALVGPNGSGKTTALKLLLGLEQPTEGSIELLGGPPSQGLKLTGYVPQQAPSDRAFPITVRETVRLGRLAPLSRRYGPEDRAAVEEALKQADMTSLADRPFGALSGGERRRVLVARALAAQPELLVLDEPSANMDAESEERLFSSLGRIKGKTTILIVTHDTGFVSTLTDRVLCMGGREGPGRHGIVQHRLEAAGRSLHQEEEPCGAHGSRIIHGENLPGDSCFVPVEDGAARGSRP